MITIWEFDTLLSKLPFRCHRPSANAVAWSPDGTRIATAGDDRTVHIWDASVHRPVLQIGFVDTAQSVDWHDDSIAVAHGSDLSVFELRYLDRVGSP